MIGCVTEALASAEKYVDWVPANWAVYSVGGPAALASLVSSKGIRWGVSSGLEDVPGGQYLKGTPLRGGIREGILDVVC